MAESIQSSHTINPLRRFDMHVHGPISFHDYSLKVQGYAGKNLLKLIIDSCLQKGIGLCGIISNNHSIQYGSIHDRFNYLIDQFGNELSEEYEHDKIGANLFHVKKGGLEFLLVNGQSILVNENGKIFDHLVIGGNKMPDNLPLEDVFKHGEFIHISEHPFNIMHRGIGEELLTGWLDYYDAIEHNSQQALPNLFSHFPFVKYYSEKVNEKARLFALKHQKPLVASSDAHSIEQIGNSHIILNSIPNFKSEGEFLDDIRNKIRDFSFKTVARKIPLLDYAEWIIKGKIGEVLNLYNE